uniref:Uncharacterized protein n=1 Tax=Anguilla anguilla TaxID=7936 RepID=A0A0E9VTB1_ANGAN
MIHTCTCTYKGDRYKSQLLHP